MLALLTVGKLKQAKAFVENDVTPEMIENIPIATKAKANHLNLYIKPLENIGRQDLVKAIKLKIFKFKIKQYLHRIGWNI